MPDVVSEVHSLNLNGVDEFMDDEHRNRDPLLSHLNGNSHSSANLLDLDHLTNDVDRQHHHHISTVDMSNIDPIISNFSLIEAMQQNNDTDSLINDIDMMT
jgi:hypothetical protein